MGMTMTQKILAAHAGLESVQAGQLINAKLDMVLGNDVTSPVAINEMNKFGKNSVFDKTRISLVMDHFTPNKDIQSAQNCKQVREFAAKFGIKHYYDVGTMGIEHALLPEQGIVTCGDCIIGADSHTCTYGALGAFSTGVGSTDMAAGMVTGMAWFKVPSAIKVVITGKKSKYICGKDVILDIIGRIGVDGALYQSLEFVGDGVSELSMDDRFTICNMAIECGAKNGIFPVDEKTLEYVNGRSEREYKVFEADEDAEYNRTITENTRTFDDIPEIKIDQVVIGSCTNGRMEDMRMAASVLKGKKVAKNVRTIIIPATQQIYLQCIKEGLAEIFIEAGAIVSTPTCGPCLGGHMGILAKGEKAVSTSNRNFVGRMGHTESEIYLASPAVAAASAIKGCIADPATL